MLFMKLLHTLLWCTAAFAVGPDNIRVTVNSNNQVVVDIPTSYENWNYVSVLQSTIVSTFVWSDSGSSWYECTGDDQDTCTAIYSANYDNSEDTVFQAYSTLNNNPDANTYARYISPTISYPEYGIFTIGFYVVVVTDSSNNVYPITATVYNLAPSSSSYYTWVPTTVCQNNDCETTNIPELKETITTVVDGVAETITSYTTISAATVEIQSYKTTSIIVTNGSTISIVTYCPLTATETPTSSTSTTTSSTPSTSTVTTYVTDCSGSSEEALCTTGSTGVLVGDSTVYVITTSCSLTGTTTGITGSFVNTASSTTYTDATTTTVITVSNAIVPSFVCPKPSTSTVTTYVTDCSGSSEEALCTTGSTGVLVGDSTVYVITTSCSLTGTTTGITGS
ncbi:hypothetical protein C6P42_003056, partial [Pichia californica]